MLKIRNKSDRTNSDLWELLGEKRKRLLDRSWAGVFREHLLPVVPVKKLADQFHLTMGRPTKELHVVVGMAESRAELADSDRVKEITTEPPPPADGEQAHSPV